MRVLHVLKSNKQESSRNKRSSMTIDLLGTSPP